ncbi:MAG TPA: hypothetical protein VNN73_20840 [Blastocatellia bacterium]|nr:hypothetical protein [Blastocatellia bacterium]
MRFNSVRLAILTMLFIPLIVVPRDIVTDTNSMVLKNTNYSLGDSQTAGQNKANNGGVESTKPHLQSLSPYDIASFIADNPDADLRTIWDQLGIKSLNFGPGSISSGEEGQIDRFLIKCNGCDVETYAYDLDAEPGREVLLKVSDLLAESCRYLLFKRLKNPGSKQDWKLLGHIDHGFGRYRMPEHFTVFCGGKSLLTVNVQEGSGSGFALYYNRLFQVDSAGVKEVLRFPAEGHLSTCCYYPAREFTARVVKCESNNSTTTVELEFSVSYSSHTESDDVQLWKKRQKAIYFAWTNDLSLCDQAVDVRVNYLLYERRDGQGQVQRWTWITNLPLRRNNVERVMRAGGARWKIENETFNTLKNQGYHFEHNYGHGYLNLATVLALLMLLAFTVDQIQQHCWELFRPRPRWLTDQGQGGGKACAALFKVLVFRTMAALCRHMAYQYDIQLK